MTPRHAYKASYSDYMMYPMYFSKKFQNTREEREKIISKDSYYSYSYAIDVLRGRFELGDYIISCKTVNFKRYYSYFYTDANVISFYYKFI